MLPGRRRRRSRRSSLSRRGSLYLTRPSLFNYIVTRQELDQRRARAVRGGESKKIRVVIGQKYPWRRRAKRSATWKAAVPPARACSCPEGSGALQAVTGPARARSGRALREMPSAPLRTTSSSSPRCASAAHEPIHLGFARGELDDEASVAGSSTRPPLRTTWPRTASVSPGATRASAAPARARGARPRSCRARSPRRRAC